MSDGGWTGRSGGCLLSFPSHPGGGLGPLPLGRGDHRSGRGREGWDGWSVSDHPVYRFTPDGEVRSVGSIWEFTGSWNRRSSRPLEVVGTPVLCNYYPKVVGRRPIHDTHIHTQLLTPDS